MNHIPRLYGIIAAQTNKMPEMLYCYVENDPPTHKQIPQGKDTPPSIWGRLFIMIC